MASVTSVQAFIRSGNADLGLAGLGIKRHHACASNYRTGLMLDTPHAWCSGDACFLQVLGRAGAEQLLISLHTCCEAGSRRAFAGMSR